MKALLEALIRFGLAPFFYVVLAAAMGLSGCGKGVSTRFCGGYSSPLESSYILPFFQDESYIVTQGNCESHSHFDRTRYAYDFGMSIGTRIRASRAGRVVDLKEDSVDSEGGNANYLVIDHEDGTYSYYFHLRENGVNVSIGDTVAQGDFVGISGNTGQTTGPHLHFDVRSSLWGETLPVTFRDVEEESEGLLSGESYTAGPINF